MGDRLFIAVIGERHSGKSTTWKALFGKPVRTGRYPRCLMLKNDISTEVFVISGSNEERKVYAKDVLKDIDCRIVLCSVQYTQGAFDRTWHYVFKERFLIYAQWLNPGHDGRENWDSLGMVNVLLQHDAVLSIRDGRKGKRHLNFRVEEIRQFIYGWAAARGLAK